MSKRLKIKRVISALTALIIVCSISLTATSGVTSSAVPEDASYEEQLAELEKQAEEIDEKINSANSDIEDAEAQKEAIEEKIEVV